MRTQEVAKVIKGKRQHKSQGLEHKRYETIESMSPDRSSVAVQANTLRSIAYLQGFVVLSTGTRYLDTLETVVDGAVPLLKLEPRIGSVREDQWVPTVLLDGLCVEVLCLGIFSGLEARVAFFFEFFRQIRH